MSSVNPETGATDQTQSIALVTLCAVFIPIASAATVVRTATRWHKNGRLAISDVLVIIGHLWSCAMAGATIAAIAIAGWNSIEFSALSVDNQREIFKIALIDNICWILSTASLKIAVTLLFIEIFPRQKFHFMCYAMIAFIMAYCICFFVLNFVQCQPFNYYWDKSIEGSCFSIEGESIASTVISMFIDFVLVILPIPEIWRTHMNQKRKIGFTAVFSLGLIICGVNIARIVVNATQGTGSEAPRNTELIVLLALLELWLGTIVASAPTLALYAALGVNEFQQTGFGRRMTHILGRGSSLNHLNGKQRRGTSVSRKGGSPSPSPKSGHDLESGRIHKPSEAGSINYIMSNASRRGTGARGAPAPDGLPLPTDVIAVRSEMRVYRSNSLVSSDSDTF